MIRFVRSGEVALAVETRGTGPRRLLFVHGWISGRRMWYDVAGRLDPLRYTAHLVDFRGAGLSDRPSGGHDLDGYAADLRAVLDDVRPDVLVAHSMGAKVAQYVAASDALPLERLVLVAPGSARAYAMSAKHRALAEAAYGSRARIETFQRAAMRRDVAPDVMERIVTDALIAQREAWFGWYDNGRSVDFADRLGAIRIPTVAVAGENDPLAPPARVKRDVADAIPGALFVELRRAGHNLPIETPDEIAGLIARVA
ncbi:MAG TPA: alpha/beta fold hydrolase [Candidatus Elarobacter sp.]|jgi:pimeloyl-ACP methyl ester carboxylesterase|nr:alpha/beta fold hydrolase [Candidatus Elarobacter sp.]